MRRTERWWGPVVVTDPRLEECPVCGDRLRLDRMPPPYAPVLPGHLEKYGLSACSGGGRTLTAARELARLRLRAHP